MGHIINLDKINIIKRDIVRSILSEINDYEYLDKVIIFGSSIRKDCTNSSDLDIALQWTEDCYDDDGVLKPFTLPVYKAISLSTEGNNDVVCIGYEGDLLKNAIQEGVVVYERNNA